MPCFPETPDERYKSDPVFHQLVSAIEYQIRLHDLRPLDVGTAAAFACVRYERTIVRQRVVYVDGLGNASFSL